MGQGIGGIRLNRDSLTIEATPPTPPTPPTLSALASYGSHAWSLSRARSARKPAVKVVRTICYFYHPLRLLPTGTTGGQAGFRREVASFHAAHARRDAGGAGKESSKRLQSTKRHHRYCSMNWRTLQQPLWKITPKQLCRRRTEGTKGDLNFPGRVSARNFMDSGPVSP